MNAWGVFLSDVAMLVLIRGLQLQRVGLQKQDRHLLLQGEQLRVTADAMQSEMELSARTALLSSIPVSLEALSKQFEYYSN